MVENYILFIFSTVISIANTLVLFKNFQTEAGTNLPANILYMLVNGVISAAVPAAVLLIQGTALEFTWYSCIMSVVIVSLSAVQVICTFKAYEAGQIATANILGTLGNIILPCLWGVVVLREALSIQSVIAIAVMLAAVVLIGRGSGEKQNKKLFWLYALIVLGGSSVNILSKQHQVETVFATVDTLSFSVIVALSRIVLVSMIAPLVAKKQGKEAFRFSKKAVLLAAASSLISGSAYIIILFANKVLPIVVTSPLSTGLNIIMSALLPWAVYREKLSKKQLVGVALSLAGSLLFLIGG